jgi:hypothetical protein
VIAAQTRLTVDLLKVAAAPRRRRGGRHVAHRQAAHHPSDHQRLQRVGLGHPTPKRRDAKRSVVPRSFGRSMVTGPAVVLIVVGQEPLRAPGRASWGGSALVAGPAEGLGHLGLHRGLDDQAGAQAGDVLEDLDQVTVAGEQGIDLGTDAIGG